MIDEKKLKDYLIEEYDYPAFMVEKTLEKVEKLDSEVYNELEKWFESGQLSDIEIGGYTVKTLIDKYKMTEVGAFLTLDWLKREPEEAKKALLKGIK